MKNNYLGKRIERYVRRYFWRSNRERYPTIAEVARGLRVGMMAVYDEVEACGEIPFMLTNTRNRSVGDYYVELLVSQTEGGMNEDKYPTEQISQSARDDIACTVAIMSERHAVPEAICAELLRIGYESGWNDALSTDGAMPFHRVKILNSHGGNFRGNFTEGNHSTDPAK